MLNSNLIERLEARSKSIAGALNEFSLITPVGEKISYDQSYALATNSSTSRSFFFDQSFYFTNFLFYVSCPFTCKLINVNEATLGAVKYSRNILNKLN